MRRFYLFIMILPLAIVSCSKENSPKETKGEEKAEQVNLIVDHSEDIDNLISSFDFAVKSYLEDTSLSEEETGNLFLEESIKRGVDIKKVSSSKTSRKSNVEEVSFSNEYLTFSNRIVYANEFSSKEDYINNLHSLKNNVMKSNISIEEKQKLIDNVQFMIKFVNWMETIKNQNGKNLTARFLERDWWDSWGKCITGSLGGILSGLTAGGLSGAAVGTVALPVVGTVSAGTVGAICGGIGGGLSGVAAFC